MSDNNSLVPVVANTLAELSGKITNLVMRARANGVIQRTQLEMLREQTIKVLADARSYHSCEIVITNLDQIARTQEHIDCLERQGRLHGKSLEMAMEQLSDLNNILRRILQKFNNIELG